MAREFYGYFDSVSGDEREYDASQLAHILRAAVKNGVTSHSGGGLIVTAQEAGMNTRVSPGGCVINGYLYVLSDDGGGMKTFAHPASASSDRIDRIVARLELMSEARKISLKLLTGTPGAAPVPPALTRSESIYELSLAQVKVRAGAAKITSADVTDERGNEAVCGYAVSVWLSQTRLDQRYGVSTITDEQVDAVLRGVTDWGDDAGLSGGVSQNALTAERLETPRVIALSGASHGMTMFDGSADVEIETTMSTLSEEELETILK